MTKSHVFDTHVEAAQLWVREVAKALRLEETEHRRALHALRAGLHAIRDRLPAAEVLDLAAQLPTMIRGFYFEGWTMTPKVVRDRAGMIASVKSELTTDQHLDPVEVLRATIHVLIRHVSTGEIEHVLATLSRPIVALWHELSGHAVAAPSPTVERTGYSR